MFDGDVCVEGSTSHCAEVHVNAENFAVNPHFSCKIVVRFVLTKLAVVTVHEVMKISRRV